jgi:hypothetical protein
MCTDYIMKTPDEVRRSEEMRKRTRRNGAFEAAVGRAEQLAKLTRPNSALEESMRRAEEFAKLVRPNPAFEESMRRAEELAKLMRPSAAFEESIRRAAELHERMIAPSRALEESLRRTTQLANAMHMSTSVRDSFQRTQELLNAAEVGSALRKFIWDDTSEHEESGVSRDEPTSNSQFDDQPELIVSREFGADSLLTPSSGGLVGSCAPSLLALRRLFSRGIDLGKITWRELEEIVGELLCFDGYDVQVGPGTKDRGVDVLASKMIPHVGLLRTVWQAKHLKTGNKVALKTIRELADIRNQEGATKGIIVTTGFLTSGALRRIQQDAYRLGKIDRPELENWIRHTLNVSG